MSLTPQPSSNGANTQDPDAAPGRVLVVGTDPDLRKELSSSLREQGFESQTACSGRMGLQLIEEYAPDVVLTDLAAPEIDGLELIDRGRRRAPHTAFIVMTGPCVTAAVGAMKRGAESCLAKPLELEELSRAVKKAVEQVALARQAARLQTEECPALDGIIGEHSAMKRVLHRVAKVARSRATAVITGESGTGKELIARAIHDGSCRRDGPFVRLNCAALAESVLESELFGHERGSFTGAIAAREGRFEQAHGGTLFLDEVSEIPMAVQVKLLRFLQERELERVGGNRTIAVDTRVVAATNRDLAEVVAEGTFREDLFYRLSVVRIEVPPLRSRRSDIPLLATFFLKRFAEENGRACRGFTAEALGQLVGHRWPGNVRELENVIERAVVMSVGEVIDVVDLDLHVEEEVTEDLDKLVPGISLEAAERIVIQRTLEATRGSTGKAAAILGISRRKIQYKLREWGVTAREVAVCDSEPGL